MYKAIILLALIGLVSCQPEGRVYSEHKDLSPEVEWLKEDKKSFKVKIDDKNQIYRLSVAFRFATGYQFQLLKLKVKEISPSGEEKSYNYQLKIRDDKGEYIGDPGYDIWDSEHVVEQAKTYVETGEYTYIFEHDMPNDPLIFAMEIGLIVDKVE